MTTPMSSTHVAVCPKRASGTAPSTVISSHVSVARSRRQRSAYTVLPSRPPKSQALPSGATVSVWSSRAAGPPSRLAQRVGSTARGVEAMGDAEADGALDGVADAAAVAAGGEATGFDEAERDGDGNGSAEGVPPA